MCCAPVAARAQAARTRGAFPRPSEQRFSEERRERVSRAFDEVIQKWWHADLTSLMVGSTFDSLYGLDAAAVSRFAEQSAALIGIGVPASREPFPLTARVRPRILIDRDPAGFIRNPGSPRAIRWISSATMTFTSPSAGTSDRPGVPCRPSELWRPTSGTRSCSIGGGRRKRSPTTGSRPSQIGAPRVTSAFEGRVLGPKVEEFREFLRASPAGGRGDANWF